MVTITSVVSQGVYMHHYLCSDVSSVTTGEVMVTRYQILNHLTVHHVWVCSSVPPPCMGTDLGCHMDTGQGIW